jgi:hypothetical protein
VPEHIYRLLVERARRERRSLAQQVVAVLALGLNVEVDARARRRRVLETALSQPAESNARLSDPVRLVREDRRR